MTSSCDKSNEIAGQKTEASVLASLRAMHL